MNRQTKLPVMVACPTCGEPAAWTPGNSWRPFCSERCKLIDLGQWATEKYRVPVTEKSSDDEPSS